ncbi:DMT family transporter [Lentibacter algarum]|uniref:DMT family transporter n=1 Tax=Lentibacter algarum TaxID=576131 RepID=UPI001C06F9D5|nr:DMT family transporter [Lentibacter algarum]MBU2980848.1 DMT family transporter [Lentibacter algarum]
MSADRPLLGIALMLGFCIVAPIGDAFAKLIGQTMPLGAMLFLRFLVQVILLFPFIALGVRPWRLSPRATWFCFLRTLLHITGIGFMFTALQYIPLADAIAIAFVLPFINLLLGRLLLGEDVGIMRFAACLVGFLGTLLVVQPSFAAVGWPALLPLGVAVTFSFFMLITRHIAQETDPIGLQFVSGLMALGLLLPPLFLGQFVSLPIVQWPSPSAYEWSLIIGVGIAGTLAHLLMTWSLRFAPSATVTPVQYVEIPLAGLVGLLVFADWPNPLAILGMAVTISAGLFILFVERAKHRRQPANRQQQPARQTAAE